MQEQVYDVRKDAGQLNFEIHNSPEVFDRLEPEWNALVGRSASNRIFSTLEWQANWWHAFDPGPLHVLTWRNAGGRLLAIAPLFIDDIDGERVLSLVGCKEVTDYLDIIIDREALDDLLPAVVDQICAMQPLYDRIEICNVPEASPVLKALPQLLKRRGFTVEVRQEDVCPVVKLPSTWSDYISSLDKKQRHELRRKLRRAQAPALDVDWYLVGPEHDLDTEMGHFLELMAASDYAKSSFLDGPGNRDFFRNIAAVMMERGWLRLSFLTIGGQRAASYLNFVCNNEMLVYNSGLRPDTWGHLSPGIVLLAWNIRHSIEQGMSRFDFLQGNETYKYQMGGRDEAVFNLYARAL